jgi:hypothetical protein
MHEEYLFSSPDGEIHQFHIRVPATGGHRVYVSHSGRLAPGQHVIYETVLKAEPLTFGKRFPLATNDSSRGSTSTLLHMPLHPGVDDAFHFKLSGWDVNMCAERPPNVQRFSVRVDEGAHIYGNNEKPLQPRVVYVENTPSETLRGCMRTEIK